MKEYEIYFSVQFNRKFGQLYIVKWQLLDAWYELINRIIDPL
jgi:hypothetical protein